MRWGRPVILNADALGRAARLLRHRWMFRQALLKLAEEARRLERVAVADRGGPVTGHPEPGGDHRDPDLAGQTLVDRGAEDDVRLLCGGLADNFRGLVHLEQREVVPARDGEKDSPCADDLGVDER